MKDEIVFDVKPTRGEMNYQGYIDNLEWLHYLVCEIQDGGYELPAGDYDMLFQVIEDTREFFLQNSI